MRRSCLWAILLAISVSQVALGFQFGTRWSRTAVSGAGLTQGDPTTLTWGFVPDGTNIASLG
ncbi:MAG: hypothetical protein AAGF97_18715, partial [Planctomycetota bacterium]